jgi:hypothetical protein
MYAGQPSAGLNPSEFIPDSGVGGSWQITGFCMSYCGEEKEL